MARLEQRILGRVLVDDLGQSHRILGSLGRGRLSGRLESSSERVVKTASG